MFIYLSLITVQGFIRDMKRMSLKLCIQLRHLDVLVMCSQYFIYLLIFTHILCKSTTFKLVIVVTLI